MQHSFRTALFCSIGLFFAASLFAQKAFLLQQNASGSPARLKWGGLEQYRQKNTKKGKTLVSIYTDWCGWCNKMETETFTDPGIAGYLSANYQLLRFNAEQTGEVEFNGRTYGQIRIGNRLYSELAYTLLNGRMAFPALVFLNEDLQVIQVIPGFKTPQELWPILVYFGSDEYKVKPWPAFQKAFKMPE